MKAQKVPFFSWAMAVGEATSPFIFQGNQRITGENPTTFTSGPVDEELARRFLTALRAEYVERQEGASEGTRWWFQTFYIFIPTWGR